MTVLHTSTHGITVRDFFELAGASADDAQEIFDDATKLRDVYAANKKRPHYNDDELRPLYATARRAAPRHDAQKHPKSVEFISRIRAEGLKQGFDRPGKGSPVYNPDSFEHIFCHLAAKLVIRGEDPNTLTIRKALASIQAPDLMLALLDFAQPGDPDEESVEKGENSVEKAVYIQRMGRELASQERQDLKKHALSFY